MAWQMHWTFPLELFAAVFVAFYHIFIATYKAIFPTRKSVKGEIVLITGSGSGLGRLMAQRFAKLGSTVVLWDVNQAGNEETAKLCKALGVPTFSYTVDLCSRETIYAMAERVKKEVGDVTILVNNAGVVSGKPFLLCSDQQVDVTMKVNIMAHFWTVKAFLPSMVDTNHGHVVTVASSAGVVGVHGLADYCASKFAAVGFDESIRMELTKLNKTGVKTTCVCPYYIHTGMFDGVQTKFEFLMPILQPDYVADKIINAIQTNQAFLVMPRFNYLAPLFRLLPTSLCDAACVWLGISDSMDGFRGRGHPDKAK
mmetsp:Transcript_16369/g.35491  ORF Transcript_16369/g.35491 Transcript_16369/m.35491 type:complete len:312 (-) Transcript_16369:89-1024(-)